MQVEFLATFPKVLVIAAVKENIFAAFIAGSPGDKHWICHFHESFNSLFLRYKRLSLLSPITSTCIYL